MKPKKSARPPATNTGHNRATIEEICIKFPTRPGIREKTLRVAGICFCDTPEPGSIEIPYHDLYGNPTGFCRWRLPSERANGQKYHQEPKSGVRAYIPPQFHNLPPGGDLVIVEGEFKALALIDVGIKAIGLPSFHTYVRDEKGKCQLLAGITDAIAYTKPERVLFLGDSDTATNFAFARNALFLATTLKPLPVLLPRIPIGSLGKGIDDCRDALGNKFPKFWRTITESTEKIDLKVGPGALAGRLLEREAEAIKTSVGIERDTLVRRIVRMAAETSEPLAKDRIVDFADKVLGYTRSAFKQAVQQEQETRKHEAEEWGEVAVAQKPAANSTDCEMIPSKMRMEDNPSLFPIPPATPWEEPVQGAALLDELVKALCRYAVFPAHAAVALAIFIVATYATEFFDAAPYVNLSSPEKRCGKSLVLRLLALLCDRALPAANCSEASVFRALHYEQPCLMIDEVDTFFQDKPQLRGILNAGNVRNDAAVMRTVEVRRGGTTDYDVRRYSVFGPKVFSGIGKLAATLTDRSIVIPMRRKRADESCERFRRREFDQEPLRQKCRRWVNDHAAALTNCRPVLPSQLNDRAADLWEPLLAIAEVVGVGWLEQVRNAAIALSGETEEADQTSVGTLLLADVRSVFNGANRLASADLCEQLSQMEERLWGEINHGNPINPRRLARLLKPYGVASRKIRLSDGTKQGYLADDFADAWERYCPLPVKALLNRNSGTSAVNIGEVCDLEPEQAKVMFHTAMPEGVNECTGCSDVPVAIEGASDNLKIEVGDAKNANLQPSHDKGPGTAVIVRELA